MNESREKAITRTSIIGILANVILVIFKAIAGAISGSIAIVLDAVNNLSDALSSVITIVGVKLARKKPNEKYPFGFGRIEYFSTIIISALILFAGGTSLKESIVKIIHPEMPTYTVLTVIIIVVSMAAKLVMGFYVKNQGIKYNSDALIASGNEAKFDFFISASTLLGAIVTFLFKITIDGWIGAVISVFIIKAGLEMLLEAVGHVLGNRADSEITKAIKAAVKTVPGVLGAYDLVLHNYGPDSAMGTVHVEISDELDAAAVHKITMDVQRKILEDFRILLTVGIYAVDTKHEEKAEMRKTIMEICSGMEGVINSHGYYIDLERKEIHFDIMVDFSVKDKEVFCKKVADEIAKKYPGFQGMPNLDMNYSD